MAAMPMRWHDMIEDIDKSLVMLPLFGHVTMKLGGVNRTGLIFTSESYAVTENPWHELSMPFSLVFPFSEILINFISWYLQ